MKNKTDKESLVNRLQNKISGNRFDFVKNFKAFMLISLSVIVAGILVIVFAGLNLGIDFTGGTILRVKYGVMNNQELTALQNDIGTVLTAYGITEFNVQKEGTDTNSTLSYRFQDVKGKSFAEMEEITSDIVNDIFSTQNPSKDTAKVWAYDGARISPTASRTLLLSALVAVLISFVLILVYIAVRFETLSGLTAIFTLLHDVLIMTSFVAFFRIQVNTPFVAAIITIIGYSINNTIVVFDRIRENKQKEHLKGKSNSFVVNMSINETMFRTLATSVTTILTITLIALIGVPAIREFCLPIMFGLFSGLYSSLLLASPMWGIIADKRGKEITFKSFKPKTKESNLPKV